MGGPASHTHQLCLCSECHYARPNTYHESLVRSPFGCCVSLTQTSVPPTAESTDLPLRPADPPYCVLAERLLNAYVDSVGEKPPEGRRGDGSDSGLRWALPSARRGVQSDRKDLRAGWGVVGVSESDADWVAVTGPGGGEASRSAHLGRGPVAVTPDTGTRS